MNFKRYPGLSLAMITGLTASLALVTACDSGAGNRSESSQSVMSEQAGQEGAETGIMGLNDSRSRDQTAIEGDVSRPEEMAGETKKEDNTQSQGSANTAPGSTESKASADAHAGHDHGATTVKKAKKKTTSKTTTSSTGATNAGSGAASATTAGEQPGMAADSELDREPSSDDSSKQAAATTEDDQPASNSTGGVTEGGMDDQTLTQTPPESEAETGEQAGISGSESSDQSMTSSQSAGQSGDLKGSSSSDPSKRAGGPHWTDQIEQSS